MTKKEILIVGGGFAGVKAALELAGDERFNVTLVSDKNYLLYYPTLCDTATGGSARQAQIPFDAIFEDDRLTVIIGTAKTIDRRNRTVTLETGENLSYDTVLLALGSVTNHFGIQGLEEFSYGVKSVAEINRLKAHLHSQLTNEHHPDPHYVIVGGGPTGIELAGMLGTYVRRIMKNHHIRSHNVRIDIVESSPQLLPRLSKGVSKAVAKRLHKLGVRLYLGQTVGGQTTDQILINDQPLTSHTVVWTAGVSVHPFFKQNGFGFGQHSKVAVNVYLQADDNVYVLGDNANTPYSGMAQTALHDAKFVAQNLKREASGKALKPYIPKKPVSVIPVGAYWAAVQWGSMHLSGFVGWILRKAADLRAFHNFQPWWGAGQQLLTEFDEEEDCPQCQLATKAYTRN